MKLENVCNNFMLIFFYCVIKKGITQSNSKYKINFKIYCYYNKHIADYKTT